GLGSPAQRPFGEVGVPEVGSQITATSGGTLGAAAALEAPARPVAIRRRTAIVALVGSASLLTMIGVTALRVGASRGAGAAAADAVQAAADAGSSAEPRNAEPENLTVVLPPTDPPAPTNAGAA